MATTANFHCKQNEMLAVAQIGQKSYMESQAQMVLHKGKYTVAWGTTFKAEIDAAKNMRNFQARNSRAEELKVRLDAKNKEICDKWQGIKLYIAEVPGWEDIQRVKLEEAGWLLYDSAYKGNWSSTMELVANANVFMTDNSAALVTPDNMPAAFITDFAALGVAFNDLFDEFEDANQDSETETRQRMLAYNALYDKLMAMFADGAYVNRNDDTMMNRFIFAKVLEMIRGASTPIKTFAIAANGKVKVERIVTGSKITNTGSTTLFVEAGAVETQGPGAVELQPETAIPTPGATITVFNSENTAGEFEARVTVD